MGILQVDWWMAQSVNCYLTWVQARHSCQSHSTCVASHSTRCQILPPRIQVGNGQCVSVLFIIPVSIDVHRHIFEIYTLVSEIH